MNYSTLVLNLLKLKKYPVLLDYVILDIYYKTLSPKKLGKQYSVNCNIPEIIYEKENEATKITYMTTEGNYFYIYKEDIKDLNIKNLPQKCLKIKLNRGFINKILKTSFETFEEEIYTLLSELNFNIPKIREILNLSFIESSCFIPECIQMWVFKYNMSPITGQGLCKDYFGPSNDLIDSRMIMGKLATCTSKDKILSLRNSEALKNDEENENLIPIYLLKYERYTYHYITEFQTYIPLAYNPLENPIIY